MDFANEVKQSLPIYRKAHDKLFFPLLNFIYAKLAINYEHTSVEN